MVACKKKEGRPLPWREVPRRPKFHQPGCGFEPVRRYNDPKGDLFPARDLFPVDKMKRHPPRRVPLT
jgi:hypothetical protein